MENYLILHVTNYFPSPPGENLNSLLYHSKPHTIGTYFFKLALSAYLHCLSSRLAHILPPRKTFCPNPSLWLFPSSEFTICGTGTPILLTV